jgi:hypothetical protein
MDSLPVGASGPASGEPIEDAVDESVDGVAVDVVAEVGGIAVGVVAEVGVEAPAPCLGGESGDNCDGVMVALKLTVGVTEGRGEYDDDKEVESDGDGVNDAGGNKAARCGGGGRC